MVHKKQRKKRGSIVRIIVVILAVLVVIQIVSLVLLYVSVGSYKKFWTQKAKEPGEIIYLALGDSAAQGIGATSPMRGYVGLVAKRLESETGKKVKIINVSVTGATIADALRDQIPQIRSIKPDVTTIEIGANDIKTFQPEKFEKEFSKLLTYLPKGTYVSDMPLFNSRPSSTEPANKASVIIRKLVQDNPDLRQVNLEQQTTSNQSIFGFAPDLFHPNNSSYQHWADAFWEQMQDSIKNSKRT